MKIAMDEDEHRAYHKKMIYVIIIMLLLLFGGATFYHKVEKWRFLDALYFSSYTMTTVGYGDITPKTDMGKIFTIFYVFAGVGIALYGLTLLSTHFVEVREEYWLQRLGKLRGMRIRHHTGTIWGKLKKLSNFQAQKLVSESAKSYRGKK
ncbi:two pore domain potassium channel family protein [Candidatus Woesearchaeota archaeon]|nr:two pore domain potassium channel family protein [Candidatus Woesearchaeota archaeon]